MSKSIVISGYYGFGNTGDEAVLAGMLETFKAVGIDARVTVFSADPARTVAEHAGVDAVHRYRVGGLARAIRGADLVISGGGSLFQDVTSTRSVRYYLFVLQLARIFRRRTMVYSQGIGPLNTKSMREAVARTLNRTDLITVRDEDSKTLLESMGVNKVAVHLAADPALLLEPDLEAADRILKECGVGGDIIGISLRPWPRPEGWLEAAAKGIEEACAELNVTPALIPMRESEDMAVCETLGGCIVLRGSGRPEVVKGLISRCGLVVGMRLHALILAAGEGVPFVPVSYDPKVTSFASAAGASLCPDVESLDAGTFRDAIIQSWRDRKALATRVRGKASRMKNLALKSGKLARDLLEEH